MKTRNVGLSILFCILTCGIYNFFWISMLSNEVSEYLGEERKGTMDAILGLVTCGLYFIYWNYKEGKAIADAQEKAGVRVTDNSIIYLVASLFGFGMIPVWIMQSDFNKIVSNR